MCHVIESSQLLANCLVSRETITIAELNELAKKIQQALPSVCVDVSHYSIVAALEAYPSMFRRTDPATICRPATSESSFDVASVQSLFNRRIPLGIREKFLAFF
jgi:hypothetical protein